jgi:hypothetical protein
MTMEQLRNLHHATPFEPFTIHMADGRTYHVPHRDFLSYSPSGRTIVVHQLDDSFGVIDRLLVTDLFVQRTAAAPSNGQQA